MNRGCGLEYVEASPYTPNSGSIHFSLPRALVVADHHPPTMARSGIARAVHTETYCVTI